MIELGQLEPLRDFCFCTDGVRGHLTVAAHGDPGDVYVYGQGENISMADWAAMILEVGEEDGYWPAGREIVTTAARFRPGASEVLALRVGYEKLKARDGLGAEGLLGRRGPAHDRLVCGESRALARPGRLDHPEGAATPTRASARHRRRRLSRLVPGRTAASARRGGRSSRAAPSTT